MNSKLKEVKKTSSSPSEKENKTLSFIAKGQKIQPEGKVLSKETNISVEEIENGFLLTENTEMRIQVKDGDTTWFSITTKKYYDSNPLKTSTTTSPDESIANFF